MGALLATACVPAALVLVLVLLPPLPSEGGAAWPAGVPNAYAYFGAWLGVALAACVGRPVLVGAACGACGGWLASRVARSLLSLGGWGRSGSASLSEIAMTPLSCGAELGSISFACGKGKGKGRGLGMVQSVTQHLRRSQLEKGSRGCGAGCQLQGECFLLAQPCAPVFAALSSARQQA